MRRLILHIPHSSTNIPFKDGFMVSDDSINAEITKLTDWYTDDLFYSDDDIMVIAQFSRIFCDPERFSDDDQEIMSKKGMGVLYEKSDDGQIIRTLNADLRNRILNNFYWTHHAKLTSAVKNQIEQFSKAIIIDCHSFPKIPLMRALDQNPDRPDINIGTDAYHTPQKLIDVSVDFFKNQGYTLGVDWPYTGSIVPIEYYQKDKNIESIMLEINRGLYLKGSTNEKSDRYSETKNVIHRYLHVIREMN